MNANKDKAENAPEKDETLVNLIQENENLTKELDAITKNEGLKQLFEKYKGKNLEYQNAEGEVKKTRVESYSDIIAALVETIIDKQ
jgi:predicted patatin/cPLA2 family phospholipase